MIFLSLFITFFQIGLFGFGGGYGYYRRYAEIMILTPLDNRWGFILQKLLLNATFLC